MQQNTKYDPFLDQYLKIYQENPRSRVFAPLAEAYRKSNMVNEAIDICKEGLEYHPGFISGLVALARCYFDKQLFTDAVKELEKVVSEVPDNYLAQKLLAESYYNISDKNNSLKSYKMLLFLNPKDGDIAKKVEELEAKEYSTSDLLNSIKNTEEEIEIPPVPFKNYPPSIDEESAFITKNISKSIEMAFQEKPASEIFGIKDGDDDQVLMELSTMTIGDLLEEQGYKDKALSVYKKILNKDPYNKRIIDKIREIEEDLGLINKQEQEPEQVQIQEQDEILESFNELVIPELKTEEKSIQFLNDFSKDEWIIPDNELQKDPKLLKLNKLLKKIQKNSNQAD